MAASGLLSFTKSPTKSLRDQVRDFLKKHGTSNAKQIREAIAKNAKSAKAITSAVSMSLHAMHACGDLLSDGAGRGRLYSIEKRRYKGMRPSYAIAQSMARDPRVLDELRVLVAQVHEEIRAEVLSEAFFRVAEGACHRQELSEVVADCVKWVRAEAGAGGYKERTSVDTALGETTASLLDFISDEPTEPITGRLYLIEERVDVINRMLRDGYGASDVAHLWDTAGTSWMSRAVK